MKGAEALGELPKIGITMGDPAGIGPEILLKVMSDARIFDVCIPVVLGDPGSLKASPKGEDAVSVNEISEPSEAKGRPGQIDLVVVSRLQRGLITPGKPSLEAGKAMVNYILRAVEMTRKGVFSAMVTCPINKELMQRAGHPFDGHTQLISHLTGTDDVVMMLAGDRLRVALVTIHCALKDVPANLDVDKIYRTIIITSRALRRDFALAKPRLAVAALNPHGGESGLFGTEDDVIVAPAVAKAKDEGVHVEGPFPADSLFSRAVDGQFDAVVCMYHDQGLIPLKLLHFSDAVNITLGLPIVRTSVDHGTAYDIAGLGIADPSSLSAAIRTATTMAGNRTKNAEHRE